MSDREIEEREIDDAYARGFEDGRETHQMSDDHETDARKQWNEAYSQGFLDGRDHTRRQLAFGMADRIKQSFTSWRENLLNELMREKQ